MTTPTPQNLGARLRKTFRYEGDDDDDDIHYMDDQEQEVLITQLIQEDAKRNQFYSTILHWLTAVHMAYFGIRFLLSPHLIDFLAITSLVFSFLTVPSPNTETPGLKYPGKWWIWGQAANVGVAGLLMLYVWLPWLTMSLSPMETEGHPSWGPDTEILLVLPFTIALIGWAARRLMEAINFDDLHHARYRYKGA